MEKGRKLMFRLFYFLCLAIFIICQPGISFGSPIDDIIIWETNWPVIEVGKTFSGSITIKNIGSVTYTIGQVRIYEDESENSDGQIIWDVSWYNSTFSLGPNQTKTMSGFSGTGYEMGYYYYYIDVYTTNGAWWNYVDTDYLYVNGCNDECNAGETGCSTDKTKRWTCQENTYGCWKKSYTSCSTGYTCSTGSCVSCNECSSGDKRCSSGVPQACQLVSGCYKWVNQSACPEHQVCSSGNCVCNNVCTVGSTQCSGSQIQTCSTDSNGCRYWSSAQNCPTGQTCQSSQCVTVQTCSNDCASGQTGCDSSSQRWYCGENDGDPCLDKITINCSSDQICQSGSCVPEPTVNVTYPTGGELFNGGQTICIEWTTTGSVKPGVDIQIWDGITWDEIVTGTPNDGKECFVLPKVNSSDCKIKVLAYDSWGKDYLSTTNSFTVWTCSDQCDADSSGCNSASQKWYCQMGKDGCWEKVTENCGSGLVCLNGSCCQPNCQCGGWSNCYLPITSFKEKVQGRTCTDFNGCLQPYAETQPCNCQYTSIEWQEPFNVKDSDYAYFKLTWNGNCQGDRLSVRYKETTWINREIMVIDIEVDPYGFYGQEQVFPFLARFTDAPNDEPHFSLTLTRRTVGPDGEVKFNDIISSRNELTVIPWYSLQAADTVDDVIRLSQLQSTCNPSITLTDECYVYWHDMGINTWEDHQLNTVFGIVDWAWKGSCYGCGAALGAGSVLMVLTAAGITGGPVGLAIAGGVVLVGEVACGICGGGLLRGVVASETATITEMAIETQLLKRTQELAKLGTTAEYKAVKNGGYVTYLEDGTLMTEVYGISSKGSGSLTFFKKIPAFPVELAENYELINFHRNVVPITLAKFQAVNTGFGAEVVRENSRIVERLVSQRRLEQSINSHWNRLCKGNDHGSWKNYVSEIEFDPEKLFLSGAVDWGTWGSLANPENIVIPRKLTIGIMSQDFVGPSGRTILAQDVILESEVPHEVVHKFLLGRIQQLKNPLTNSFYKINWNKLDGKSNVYFASEFFADTVNLHVLKSDPILYQNYIDGFYATIQYYGRETWIDNFILKFAGNEDTIIHAYRNYWRTALSDPEAASLATSKLEAYYGKKWLDDFWVKSAEMENDFIFTYEDSLVPTDLYASSEANSILSKYGIVVAENPINLFSAVIIPIFFPGITEPVVPFQLYFGPDLQVKNGEVVTIHGISNAAITKTDCYLEGYDYYPSGTPPVEKINRRLAPQSTSLYNIGDYGAVDFFTLEFRIEDSWVGNFDLVCEVSDFEGRTASHSIILKIIQDDQQATKTENQEGPKIGGCQTVEGSTPTSALILLIIPFLYFIRKFRLKSE